MGDALAALARWYRTGTADDRRAYDIAWVADKDSPVDTINGFTEVYMDARGRQRLMGGVGLLRQPRKDRHDPHGG